MTSALNTRCQICGKMYHHCLKCKELAAWKAIADTHEHYQIAMVLSEYREGVVNATEAKTEFANIGITANSDFSAYLPEVTRDIKNIIALGTETKKANNYKK